jgi:hypothetical protein
MIAGLYGNIASNASSTKQNVNFVLNFKFEKNLIVAFLLSPLTCLNSKPRIFYGGERNEKNKRKKILFNNL